MPANFLTQAQRKSYGTYVAPPTAEELARFFHLSDDDLSLIIRRRGRHNRLGFAIQLGTVRFIGTFLMDPLDVPPVVLQTMASQLGINQWDCLNDYRIGKQRWKHTAEIRTHYGYREITDFRVGFRLNRLLCELSWTGTDRPIVLFDHAKSWLLAHKILLPGVSVVERLVTRVRTRMGARLWRLLAQGILSEQRRSLEQLLNVSEGSRNSLLDQLRSGPTRVSAPALVRALSRLQDVRTLGIHLPASKIPLIRISALARIASTSKASAIARLPRPHRLAALIAFVYCLEPTAHDDALDVLNVLLKELFARAKKENKKRRLRSLKDLDHSASRLADAQEMTLDDSIPDNELRSKIYEKIPRKSLAQAYLEVRSLVQPPDDIYFRELLESYRSVRLFLPAVLKHLQFASIPKGQPVVDAFAWLRENESQEQPIESAPRDVIRKHWKRYVIQEDGSLDRRAYTFCALKEFHTALNRRDVFVPSSWRYGDPRAGLLTGQKWEASRPMVCRTLGFSADANPVLTTLSKELDETYRAVIARLPNNPAVRFETVKGKPELILSPLDKLEETDSLIALKKAVMAMLPRIDLPELILEIASRTHFTDAFTHISERSARASDLWISLCAVLMAEACNTGIEPLIRDDIPTLKRDRLLWVLQNYFRNETIIPANAKLVSAQSKIPLARRWGGGDVASADGMRFVVPVRTVHGGYNPKYFGQQRGVTWYNLVSNQFSGLNAVTVPGTMRDSLSLLAVVLDQQTELQPFEITSDTGAYSDVVFGLFRLLGYRFCPRLADIGGTRFWKIDPHADYGPFNGTGRNKINLPLIADQWDDMLRLAGSLKLGLVPATGIMRTLQVGERATSLALALTEFGRIDKTIHSLTYIDDENKRRGTLVQLNIGEGRHGLGRAVFHGKRGELHQKYREGQEDQLGALGLVLNIIVLWNTIYMNAALNQLRSEGFLVRDEDVARLSPLVHEHINMLGHYSFAIPDKVIKGELRKLRKPETP